MISSFDIQDITVGAIQLQEIIYRVHVDIVSTLLSMMMAVQ